MKSVFAEERTNIPLPSENISLSYGLVKVVEHYLGSVRISDHVNGFKERGVPSEEVMVAACTCIPMGSNSMTRCTERLLDENIRKELGIEGKVS